MTTSGGRIYSHPPYQSSVNVPVGVVVQPVIIPVVTGQNNQEHDTAYGCMQCCGFLGGLFLSVLLITLAIVRGDGGERIYKPIMVVGTLGVICSVTACICYASSSSAKRKRNSRDNTQPISEPFTQNQMNQGSSMYVPMQPAPSAPPPYSAQMSNVQQPFLPAGVNTATGAPQNFESKQYSPY